jgi:hypothetical protein
MEEFGVGEDGGEVLFSVVRSICALLVCLNTVEGGLRRTTCPLVCEGASARQGPLVLAAPAAPSRTLRLEPALTVDLASAFQIAGLC